MVPSLSHNIESQTHSRVSECDGRPPVQVQPSAVDTMVTASTGVQTDLPQVVHSSCRPVCPKACNIDALNINRTGPTAYALPSNSTPSQGDPKIRQCHSPIIIIASGRPGMPWYWDLVQLSTEIPLQLPASTTLLKQSHNYVLNCNLQISTSPWCLGVDNSKNKASQWMLRRELLPLSGHQQGPSISQSGPSLKNGAGKIR